MKFYISMVLIMETIKKDKNTVLIKLDGDFDSITSLDIEPKFMDAITDAKNVTVDLTDLDYITSAGLRVLLCAQKQLRNNGGNMIVTNPNSEVMAVFKVTGFTRLLNIAG